MAAILGRVSAVLVLSAAVASAETPEPGAEQLFRRGRELMAQKKFGEACAALEESQRREPALGTLLNIADCFEQLGRTASAFLAFNEAAAWAGRNKELRRSEVATQRAQALKPRLAFLAVNLAGSRSGAVAQIIFDADSSARGPSWPLDGATQTVPLDPGAYTLRVTIEGHRPAELKFEVKAAPGLIRLDVPPLDPLAAESPPAPVPSPLAPSEPRVDAPIRTASVASAASPRPGPWLGVLGVALGGALLITSAVGAGYSRSVLDRVARQQPGGPDYDAPTVTRAEYATVQALYPGSWIALGVGAAALTTGVVLLVRSRAPVTVGLVPLPGGAWFLAGLTWS